MTAAGATCVVVDGRRDGLGILTDRDLRTRVVADGLSADAPVSAAMTAPAVHGGGRPARRRWRCSTCSTAASATCPSCRRPAGSSASSRTPTWRPPRRARRFTCARRSRAAPTVDALAHATRELRPTIVALHRARAATRCASPPSTRWSSTRSPGGCIELAVAEVGPARRPVRLAGAGQPGAARGAAGLRRRQRDRLAGRRPRTTSSSSYALAISRRVEAGLRACGLRPDERGTTAANPLLVRSLASWQRAARSWLEDPTQEQALILVSVVVDSRPVWGLAHRHVASPRRFRDARSHPALLRQLARFSLSYRPPTGFLRGLVVEHSGEHRGRLDLKHGGARPDRRPRPLGGDGRRGHERLDARAPARRGRGGHAVGGRRRHAGRRLPARDGACASSTRSRSSRPGAEPDDHLDPASAQPAHAHLPQGGLPRGGLRAEAGRRRTGGRRRR